MRNFADLGASVSHAAEIVDGLRRSGEAAIAARSPSRLMATLSNGCWIYGAGDYGRLVLRLLQARDIPVRGFIDRRADALAGRVALPVVHPDSISRADTAGLTAIIALHNFAADQRPVVAWARATGFAETLIPAELVDLFGPDAGSYWLTDRGFLLSHLDALERLFELLADEQSVEIVAALARFRLTGDIDAHPTSNISDQYFPRDLPLPAEPLRLVDGGAYLGESLADAARAGGRIAEWYAFEPDAANFEALTATAAHAPEVKAKLFPCGLSDHCGDVSFVSGEDAGSRMVEAGGDTTIKVVALDAVLPDIEPNFIKLDIEGAEAAALDGMRNAVARARPRLAISIYHRPEDLWQIPLKVSTMLPGARLHVRQHGFNGFDTVLYAIP